MRLHLNSALLLGATLLYTVIPSCSADGLPNLRILPLGDSITKGNGASDNNGYRKRLHDKLTNDGAEVDMIGTLHTGSMTDNDHEGHSGEFLGDITRYWQAPLKAYPNVVLVHAGTNNMDLERDLDKAPALMESIIDGILQTAADPVVLVAPVIWANDARMQANTDKFNAALSGIISQRQNAGKHVMSVPISITKQDLWDKKHPNDGGYEKNGQCLIDANSVPGVGLGSVGSGGADPGAPSGCKGGNWKSVGPIFDDFRVWASPVDAFSAPSGTKRGNVILADIDGDGHTDVMIAEDDGTVTGYLKVKDTNQWTNIGHINPPWKKVTGDMIRMADVDNDGRADMIVLYSNGAAKVWRNSKNGRAFESMDEKWATGVESREKIRFADMDGDGYADYVILYDGGAVKWLRNTHNNGKDDKKSNWESAQTIAPGVSGEESKSAHLYDLDGDGKADYVLIRKDGSVRALRNTGNLNKDSNQRNWEDLGTIAPGVGGVTGDMIVFSDFNGDGRADFVTIDAGGSMRMWQNLGVIGKSADNIRFADLNGDGKDDVIYVSGNGMARAWLNQGLGRWKDVGVIAPGLKEDLSSSRIEFADVNGDKLADFIVIYGGGAVKAYLNHGNIEVKPGGERVWSEPITIAPGVGEPGRKVRIQDLDGDGYADYLVLYDGGSVDFYRNRHNIPQKDNGRIWEDKKIVATGAGEPGDKVRFADITGDGLAEYVIQYEGGASKAMWNTGKIKGNKKARYWSSMGVIAAGVREQGPVRYGDVNGDGKADYLVVHETGRISAWINTCDWKPPKDGPPPDDGDDGDDGDGGDGDKKCSPKDRPYSSEDMPEGGMTSSTSTGTNLRVVSSGPQNKRDKMKMYVTVVNMTPYKFVYTGGPEPYKFLEWDFGDVPSGKARDMEAEYNLDVGSMADTNGYANFDVEGTDKKFTVHVTQHVNDKYEARVVFDLGDMGRGNRELGFPGDTTKVALVIGGSEEFGYIDSLNLHQQDWMHGMYDVIKDRQLRHVVMPGSHDGGMSTISKNSGWWGLGSEENTQTQSLHHYDQLAVGTRYFDMRIVRVNRRDFWIAHLSDETGARPLGATGDSLNDLIEQLNRFTSANPGELIIWHIRYMTEINLDTIGDEADRHWTEAVTNQFYDKLTEINNRCSDIKGDFSKLTMKTFLDQHDGKGCVLLLTDGSLNDGIPKDRPSDGIYHSPDHLPADDFWANRETAAEMAPRIIDHMKDNVHRDGSDDDKFFIMQWQATPDIAGHLRLEATLNSNPGLFCDGVNAMNPERFPTVILEDDIGVFHYEDTKQDNLTPTLQTLAIALNAYMVSQNCDVSNGKFPMLEGSGVKSQLFT